MWGKWVSVKQNSGAEFRCGGYGGRTELKSMPKGNHFR